jgi:hypothetical protein
MPIYTKPAKKGNFIIPPAGNHPAVCYNVHDLGFQKSNYQGKELISPKIIIVWEIDELIPEGQYEGKRFTITKEYTNTLSEKSNLRRDLTSWRNKPFTEEELEKFDLEKLIGINCLLNIVHKPKKDGSLKADIASIAPLAKGMSKLTPENPRTTPEWIMKKQAEQITQHEDHDDGLAEECVDDEQVPF